LDGYRYGFKPQNLHVRPMLPEQINENMTYRKNCFVCGGEFEGFANQYLCGSRQCENERRYQTENFPNTAFIFTCKWCGHEFEKRGQIYSVCDDPLCQSLQKRATSTWYWKKAYRKQKNAYLELMLRMGQKQVPRLDSGKDPTRYCDELFATQDLQDYHHLIAKIICNKFAMTENMLWLKTKIYPIQTARQLCHYFGRKFNKGTQEFTGKVFGGRSYSTVRNNALVMSGLAEYGSNNKPADMFYHKLVCEIQGELAHKILN
jgi:hypothetical protein